MNEKVADLTRCSEAFWCGKVGLHLLPQAAGFASNVSQMQFTYE